MADCTPSLQEYLLCPVGSAPKMESIPPQVISALSRFMPLSANAFFMQQKNIKRAAAACIGSGMLSDFDIRFVPKLSATAYTVDGGGMYFSWGAVLTRSSAVTMTVFCHELAHMWLSQQPFYPALKACNKAFLAAFAAQKAAYLMSPIEVYAMVGSLCIMDAVHASLKNSRQKRKLASLIDLERQKLEALRFEISMLKLPCGIDSK